MPEGDAARRRDRRGGVLRTHLRSQGHPGQLSTPCATVRTGSRVETHFPRLVSCSLFSRWRRNPQAAGRTARDGALPSPPPPSAVAVTAAAEPIATVAVTAVAVTAAADIMSSSEHRVWKAHMKMALSNERTLISWIRVGATYGSGALVAATLGQTERGTATELAGRFTLTIQALLGLAIVTWATVQFALRGRLLAARWHGSYENNVGPALFTVPQLCRKGPVWPASADQSADCPRLAEAWGSSWHGLALTGAFVEPAGRRRSQLVFDLLPGRQHP